MPVIYILIYNEHYYSKSVRSSGDLLATSKAFLTSTEYWQEKIEYFLTGQRTTTLNRLGEVGCSAPMFNFTNLCFFIIGNKNFIEVLKFLVYESLKNA